MPNQQNNEARTLRLILGDQLNISHSWFKEVNQNVTYLMMEVRSETDYVVHHIQKVVGFFAAMRAFSEQLSALGHRVIYYRIGDKVNLQRIDDNCRTIIREQNTPHFEYQLPDEFRVDQMLTSMCKGIGISYRVFDTEHFFTSRDELAGFFKGKNNFVMENFYQHMRKKHHVLMHQGQPLHGKWNFDAENRNKLPKNHKPIAPLVFDNDVSALHREILEADITTMGSVDPQRFFWPVQRKQALALLDFFAEECLILFGTYQDAMAPGEWSLYHSRLSFALNIKLISPQEVIERVITEYERRNNEIAYHQLEGFVRQIIGWREYMRGVYWARMPEYAALNFFNHQNPLPQWYWNGHTKMNCLSQCITQSLDYAYAHHIQRLMVTGNFALLAGVHPDEVDRWYLGIYIDALQWVEITNTRGMSQFADGGLLATKPYVSSAAYIAKMSHYCEGCFYKKNEKTGELACPFNSLYWHFIARHESLLRKNPRMSMMYKVWVGMPPEERTKILKQAEFLLSKTDHL